MQGLVVGGEEGGAAGGLEGCLFSGLGSSLYDWISDELLLVLELVLGELGGVSLPCPSHSIVLTFSQSFTPV